MVHLFAFLSTLIICIRSLNCLSATHTGFGIRRTQSLLAQSHGFSFKLKDVAITTKQLRLYSFYVESDEYSDDDEEDEDYNDDDDDDAVYDDEEH